MTSPRSTTDAAAATATVGAFAMIANQVGGKAVRDALFLTSFGIEALPAMVIGAALFSIVVVLFASRVITRFGPGTAAPVAYGVSGVIFLGIWPFVWLSPGAASLALYLHLSISGSVLVSWFWSVINERFDPRTARKRIARIAAGGSLGGIVGGLLAERTAALESSSGAALLPMLALLHFVCAAAIFRMQAVQRGAASPAGGRPSNGATPDEGWQAGLRTLRRAPFLRNLAVLVLVSTMAAALLDFLFKSQAAAHFPDTEGMLRFFALFYTATGLLTFAVQSTLTRRLLEGIGLGRTAAILPFAVGVGGLVLLVPGLVGMWVTAAVRGGESILRSSVFRSSYELFYTPISSRDKRAAKTLVDVGFERLGDAVGGGTIQLVLFVGALLAAGSAAGPSPVVLRVLVALVIALGLAGLLLAARLERGYVSALERSLLDRAVDLDLESVEDDTTRTAFLHTIGNLTPGDSFPASGPRSDAAVPDPVRGALPASPHDPLVARIAALRSGDVARAHAALDTPLDRALVPHVIRLLGWDKVTDAAIRSLRTVCDQAVGQLVDALVDPDEDFVIRRRIPRVLSAGQSARAAEGLLQGLLDRRFEVRYQCGAALARIRENRPETVLDSEPILAAVQREATVDRRVWESHRLLDQLESSEDTPFVDTVLHERSSRSLAHVFTMLSLVYPKRPLQIAYQGLQTSDENLRGTALEYLESILPPSVRENLWPLLEERENRGTKRRTQEDVLDSLLRSHDSIRVHLDALRGREPKATDREA